MTGHKKKKLGINREPAPFVFTPDFAYVMGGKSSPDFETFVMVACTAYNIIRKHAAMFITMLALVQFFVFLFNIYQDAIDWYSRIEICNFTTARLPITHTG